MVLPEPDSPTRPSVRPGSSSSETPSSARTGPYRLWTSLSEMTGDGMSLPGAARIGGRSVAHRATATGQRGWNGQPVGISPVGGWPAMVTNGVFGGVPGSSRADAISARVYGCSGCANASRTGACSTIRPPYITATSSAISATTPMSCVIHRTTSPRSPCSSRTSARISACTVTSSAVVGSSAISTSGASASTIAIITR